MYIAWYARRMQEEMFGTMICIESRKGMVQNSSLQGGLGPHPEWARPSTGRGEDERTYLYLFKFHPLNIYLGGIHFKMYILI